LLSQELVDEFDVHIVVGDCGQEDGLVVDDVTLHKAYSPDVESGVLAELMSLSKLFLAMKRADADVYVYRGHPRKAGIVYGVSTLLQSEYVYHVASDENVGQHREGLSTSFRWLFDRSVRRASALITQTQKQAEQIGTLYGRTPTVVPNGYPRAETSEAVEAVQPDGYVLWVGRLDSGQKRPHLFLELAEAFPDTEFRLVGPHGQDESYHREIEAVVSKRGNVIYEGVVDPDQIHEYYRNAVAVVNTSSFEGFPNTFIEAWRVETPVLSLDVDPNRFVADAELPFANGDMDALEKQLEQLHSTTELQSEYVGSASEYVATELDIQRIAARFGDILRGTIE
jgi:glycosyltransferase involved in cell wall biosynthesis